MPMKPLGGLANATPEKVFEQLRAQIDDKRFHKPSNIKLPFWKSHAIIWTGR